MRMATSLKDLELSNDNLHQLPAPYTPLRLELDFTVLRQFETIFYVDDSPPLDVAGTAWGLLTKVLLGAALAAHPQNPPVYPVHFFHNAFRNQDAVEVLIGAYELLRNHVMPLKRKSISPFQKELRSFVEKWNLLGGPQCPDFKPLNLIVLTATQLFTEFFDLDRMVIEVTNNLRNKTMRERPIRIQICRVGYDWDTNQSLHFEQFFARLRVRPGSGNFERPVSSANMLSSPLMAE